MASCTIDESPDTVDYHINYQGRTTLRRLIDKKYFRIDFEQDGEKGELSLKEIRRFLSPEQFDFSSLALGNRCAIGRALLNVSRHKNIIRLYMCAGEELGLNWYFIELDAQVYLLAFKTMLRDMWERVRAAQPDLDIPS